MFLTMFPIALGVSADAFAVAIGKGLHMQRLNLRSAFAIAVSFGVFQAGMPLIGWVLGTQLAAFITPIDHWVSFALLSLIGGKMIWEAIFSKDEEVDGSGAISVRELLLLSVATSVDALAVGITLAFMPVPIVASVLLIGVTTLVLTFAGILIGHKVGARFRGPAEIVGGAILIVIGVQILLTHLGVIG